MHPAVLLAALAPMAGQAQQPAPQTVCLTNACSEALKDVSKPATIRDAILKGEASRVRELGGSPGDAVAAMAEEARRRVWSNPDRQAATLESLAKFADTSNGARLVYQDAHLGAEMKVASTGRPAGVLNWGVDRINPDGTVQTVALLPQGGLFIGAPRKPD